MAQFSSGSDGSDGAFAPVESMEFDPDVLGLDADDDNVFHFTSITIPAGVTVTLRGDRLNMSPVFWLASGAVQIDGQINLSGEAGHPNDPALRRLSIPGPGGFPGGMGASASSPATDGFGPGGGLGGGRVNASHAGRGDNNTVESTYGNRFLLPLVGGSGGGGGASGLGGGARGGALLIASSVSINIDGVIVSDGGAGPCCFGASGSGGAIRLLAPQIGGSGTISVRGGNPAGGGTRGGSGRIRLEAFTHQFSGTLSLGFGIQAGTLNVVTLTPNTIFLPTGPAATVRVTDVDGIAVPDPPTGEFSPPDVVIDASVDVTITIEASQIPPGTQLTLYVIPETGPDQVVTSTALVGTLASSTATADVTFPNGFSRFTVRATWTP